MIRAHQPGSQPIDIPEVIPNPAVAPRQEPTPKEPIPNKPVKVPEKVPGGYAPAWPYKKSRNSRVSTPMTALANYGLLVRGGYG